MLFFSFLEMLSSCCLHSWSSCLDLPNAETTDMHHLRAPFLSRVYAQVWNMHVLFAAFQLRFNYDIRIYIMRKRKYYKPWTGTRPLKAAQSGNYQRGGGVHHHLQYWSSSFKCYKRWTSKPSALPACVSVSSQACTWHTLSVSPTWKESHKIVWEIHQGNVTRLLFLN